MKIYDNYSLKGLNTFGIDVKARRVMVVEPDDEILPMDGEKLLLGGGSNMVFTKDYDGTIMMLSHVVSASFSAYVSKVDSNNESDTPLVTAWGGMVMDELVQWTLDQGLYGLENLSAIPGTGGASAVQNVGAYGVEAKDFIERVEAYDLQKHCHCAFSNADCRFAYRDSFFKHHPGRFLILRVTYRLSCEYVPNLGYKTLEGLSHDTAQHLRAAITELRWSKLPRPEENGSAGSFFKNPVVDEVLATQLKTEHPDMPLYPGNKLSAGWLIDQCGWKGKTLGRAGVWPKNALVLYNTGGCTGDEVVALAEAIKKDVKHKFGVVLDPEAIII